MKALQIVSEWGKELILMMDMAKYSRKEIMLILRMD